MELPEDRFFKGKVKGIHIYTCYHPSSATLAEYQHVLTTLVLYVRGRGLKIIEGDFNVRALEWGSWTTNARSRVLLKAYFISFV